MTPGELLVMLLDELVKQSLRCDVALAQGDYPVLTAAADKCIAIINYLDDTLDRKYPISRELHRLYEFFCYDFNRIKIGRNSQELGRLIPMITDLRDSFREAERGTRGQMLGGGRMA